MTTPATTTAARTAVPWAFVVALLVAAFNFRAPFVAVAPITSRIRSDLGISGGESGLLTSLPVLCFGLAAPLALLVARRIGAELALVVCLGSVALGAVIRSSGPFWVVCLGTLVIGLGITVGNIVVPVLIRRTVPPGQAGLVTGAYVSVMNVGSMTVSLATEPLASAIGWRGALLFWGLLALVGLAAWAAYLRGRSPGPSPATSAENPPSTSPVASPAGSAAPAAPAAPAGGSAAPLWRTPIAWILAVAFAGQSSSYYMVTAWLPSLLHDELGLGSGAAGVSASVFQVFAIVGAIGVPVLAKTLPGWSTVLLVGVLWMCLPVQLLVAPHLFLVGSVLGGIAQGGGLASLFVAIVRASRTDRESARLSAFVQGMGYVVAAAGPSLLGLAHDATSAWTVPMLIVLTTTATFTVFGTIGSLRAAQITPSG